MRIARFHSKYKLIYVPRISLRRMRVCSRAWCAGVVDIINTWLGMKMWFIYYFFLHLFWLWIRFCTFILCRLCGSFVFGKRTKIKKNAILVVFVFEILLFVACARHNSIQMKPIFFFFFLNSLWLSSSPKAFIKHEQNQNHLIPHRKQHVYERMSLYSKSNHYIPSYFIQNYF